MKDSGRHITLRQATLLLECAVWLERITAIRKYLSLAAAIENEAARELERDPWLPFHDGQQDLIEEARRLLDLHDLKRKKGWLAQRAQDLFERQRYQQREHRQQFQAMPPVINIVYLSIPNDYD